MASASVLHWAASRWPCPPGGPAVAAPAIARRPDTQASRECVQCRLSAPKGGVASVHRFAIASAATAAARQSSSPSM